MLCSRSPGGCSFRGTYSTTLEHPGLQSQLPAGSLTVPTAECVIVGIAERCCCSCCILVAVQVLDLTVLDTFMFPPVLILQKNNLKARARHRQDPLRGLYGCACGSSSCSSFYVDLKTWKEGCRFSFFYLCFTSSVFLGLTLASLKQEGRLHESCILEG